jgi:hypothetical protein
MQHNIIHPLSSKGYANSFFKIFSILIELSLPKAFNSLNYFNF